MNRSLIIAVIIGLALFVLGGGLGVFYQTQKDALKIQEAEKKSAAVKSLSSDLVPSIVAYGEVSAIDGRNVTLFYNGKSMQIEINKDATVYSFSPSSGDEKEPLSSQQQVKISDIKKGDRLNVTIKLLPDGSLEGQMVIILGSAPAGR